MYRSHKGNDYVNSPLVGGAFLFFVCLYYIVGIRRFEFQSMIEKLLNVEHILLVIVTSQLIVGMLSEIVLVGQKRPDAPQLQDALAAIHNSQFVPAHELVTRLLIRCSKGRTVAAGVGSVVEVDGFPAQSCRQLFQSSIF